MNARSRADDVTRGRVVDAGLALALALGVLVVQSRGALLHRPFWIDEAWVADLAHAPLSRQVALSSSTPIGWALLLRLVPLHGAQDLRVLPLIFEGAAAALAFAFVRSLNWGSANGGRAAGTIAGAAVLLAPMSLVQNDLKQYSCDAALSLLVLLLARRAEQRPGLRALLWLSLTSVVVTPFSTVAVLVIAASFGGLLVVAVGERRWNDARRVLIVGGATGALVVAFLAAIVLPHENPTLRAYWRVFYLDGSPLHIVTSAVSRFRTLGPAFGVSPWLVLLLFVAGLAVLGARGHVAIAAAVTILAMELLALGAAHRYPFLDVRTSYFFLAIAVVVAAIGFAGLMVGLCWHRPVPLAAIVAVTVAVLAFGGRHEMRQFAYPNEDVRTPTRYIAEHRRPGDVVVVSIGANWAFTYYWPGPGTKAYVSDDTVASGFTTRVDGTGAIFARARDRTSVLTTMKTAVGLVASRGGTGRLWIVRTHMTATEQTAWTAALRELHLHARPVTGPPEPLLVATSAATTPG